MATDAGTRTTPAAPVTGPVAPGSPAALADPSRAATPTKPKATPKAKAPAGNAFVLAVLKGLGAPASPSNIGFLNAWIRREGGGGANNPLNTTQNMPGSSVLAGNSAGVRNYADISTGVAATIRTLNNGRYADVVGALKTGTANTGTTYSGLSTWSGNGYSNLKGVSTGTPTTASGSGTAPTAAIKDQVAAQYGYLAAFLNDPEVGPILMQAAKQGWDQPRLQGALYGTKFWQNHAAVTREFDAQTRLDPASQRHDIGQQATTIATQAKAAGVTLSGKDIATLAWTSLRYGWDAQQLTNGILAQGKLDLSGKTPGGALTTADSLKAEASQYLVPVSDPVLAKWTKDIQAGNLTTQDFTGYLKAQAKSLFPGMAVAIDSGLTPAHYVDPYKQIAMQTLEVPEDSINFMDPKWGKALFQTDPKTGQRTSMSLADWQTTLRTDPSYGYDKTAQAHQTSADLGQQLSQLAGAS